MHNYALPIAQVTGDYSLICSILQKRERKKYRITELTGKRESRGPGFTSEWLRVVFKLGWAGEQLNRAVRIGLIKTILIMRQPAA